MERLESITRAKATGLQEQEPTHCCQENFGDNFKPHPLEVPSPLPTGAMERAKEELFGNASDQIAETLFMALFVQIIKTKQANSDLEATLINKRIEQNYLREQKIRAHYFQLKDEEAKAAKKEQVLNAISYGAMIAGIILCVAGFFVGGVGGVIGVAMATASIASGSTTIAKAVAEKEHNSIKSDLIGCRFEREKCNEAIQRAADSLAKTLEEALEGWQAARELVESEGRLTRMLFQN